MDTAVSLDFANGNYRFWLPLPQVFELERLGGVKLPDGSTRNKSILTMFDELDQCLDRYVDGSVVFVGGGPAIVNDINQIIRLGLIGGGGGMVSGEPVKISPLDAQRLVAEYSYPARPISECVGVAWAILHAAINGVHLKKKAEPEVKTTKKRSVKA